MSDIIHHRNMMFKPKPTNSHAVAGLACRRSYRRLCKTFISQCRYLVLVLFLGNSVSVAAARDSVTNDLQIEAERLAAVVKIMQKKARKSLVNTAQDRAFHRYFATDRATNRRILRFHLDLILETLRDVRQMQEVALVGEGGGYIAQVKEEIVKQRDFGDRTSAYFFNTALTGAVRQAYTSSVYRSTGSNQWVISYATPIMHDGQPVALLYYNQGIDAFQRNLDLMQRNDGIRRLAVSSNGRVVWDSQDNRDALKNPGGGTEIRDLPMFSLAGLPLREVIDFADRRDPIPDASGTTLSVAYSVVNDWYLLGIMTVPAPPAAALPMSGTAH